MRVTIVYFSQTGQTLKIAEAMAGALREGKHAVNVLAMQRAQPPDIKVSDVLAVGAPCFESHAPEPVKTWLRSFPALYGKPCFVFATSGGAPGRVLYELTRGLRSKGGRVLGGFMGRGTVHHPAPCLTGRMPGRPDANDLERARAFALAVDKHLTAGNPDPLPESSKNALQPSLGFYGLVGLITQPFLLRILLPRPKLSPGLCNQCGLCAGECPAQAITLSPDPVIGNTCIRCYHCQNVCPKQALSESWWYGNLVVLSLYSTLFARLFGDIEPGETLY